MKSSIFKILLKYWDILLLFSFIAIYIYVFSTLSILRHNAFASNYDLANMSQTVWNTLHGRIFALSGAEGTISRFSIHADLILILLSPLYLIWERAYMLLVTQSIALALGAIPVYFLAKKILENSLPNFGLKAVSLIIVVAYLLNPSMQWTNIYDFHGVALAIPFLLFTFYFAYIKKWKLFWVFVFLSLITKEEISLLIASIGLAIFFIFKERKMGLMTFIVGILWFIIMTFWLIPHFSENKQYWALNWFSLLNQEGRLVIPSLKILIEKSTFSQDAINYYLNLLKPFGFLPILGFPWLALSLPELLINLFSSQAQMRSTLFHYDSGIIPSLVIATIFSLKYINLFIYSLRDRVFPKLGDKYLKFTFYLVVTFLLMVSLRVNYHYSPLPTTPSCWCLSYKVTKDDIEFDKVLKTIPKDASVTSSGEIRPHIARRENSFTLPGHVEDADFVAILDENRIVGDYSPKEFENALLKDPKFLQTHDLISHIGHFYLFKKK